MMTSPPAMQSLPSTMMAPPPISPAHPLSIVVPPDATSCVFIDGLPADISKRELAHIFRPFQGFLGLRTLIKERSNRSNEKVTKVFANFVDELAATAALQLLHGYKLDLDDQETMVRRFAFDLLKLPLFSSEHSLLDVTDFPPRVWKATQSHVSSANASPRTAEYKHVIKKFIGDLFCRLRVSSKSTSRPGPFHLSFIYIIFISNQSFALLCPFYTIYMLSPKVSLRQNPPEGWATSLRVQWMPWAFPL